MYGTYLGNLFNDIGLIRRTKGIYHLSKDQRHKRLRHSVGHGSHRANHHQDDIQSVCEGEELQERDFLVRAGPFVITIALDTTIRFGLSCFFHGGALLSAILLRVQFSLFSSRDELSQKRKSFRFLGIEFASLKNGGH